MDRARGQTWVLAAAPVVVAAGFVARPYTSDFTDDEVVAAAVTEHTARWVVAAVLMVAGAALLAFALPAAVERVGGGARRGRWTRPAATIGAVAFGMHTGLVGLGASAAARSGADVAAFLDAAGTEGMLISGGLVALLIAWVGVIRAVWDSQVPKATTWVVVVGAALGLLGHLYPASPGEYIASAGTAAALWPLAAYRPTG